MKNHPEVPESKGDLNRPASIPSPWGMLKLQVMDLGDGKEHLAVQVGDWQRQDHPVVRIHSECLTGDVFGSFRCDCQEQLHSALHYMMAHGGGVLIYLRQEGRGIGLQEKLKAYLLQEEGLDTIQANEKLGHLSDLRDFGLGSQILKKLGVDSVRLISNNLEKKQSLEQNQIKVVELIQLPITIRPENERYLNTKIHKMGHRIRLAGNITPRKS
jgi:3,4-dihydroxy 2-butanone 4-phosphate synthase/GTP cyclohydrolase II